MKCQRRLSTSFSQWGTMAVSGLCVMAMVTHGKLLGAAETELPLVTTGRVAFVPSSQETGLPAAFQQEPHQFDFQKEAWSTAAAGITRHLVTFPSPVETPVVLNNTVHCEYFCPTGPGPHPGVVVLHILGGDFDLARLVARYLAHQGVAALFLKMPYYGPRRDPASDLRMISPDPNQTVRGMTQAVLDIRRAVAWLGAQPEIDPARLGITGISLGGITGALATSLEPRVNRACFLLAGGGFDRISWESREMAEVRQAWIAQGGTQESLAAVMRAVDPVTHAHRLQGRKLLFMNAAYDEVIPPDCTVRLWEAAGKPEIIWWDAGHYSAARFLLEAMAKMSGFFAE